MANLCPNCGSDNPTGVNVCRQCAAPLARACKNCGFENPGNFKFCGNCGASLNAALLSAGAGAERTRAASPIPTGLAEKITSAGKQIEGERRTVTVLFSDISGYTGIAEKLDPEQVYEIIDSTLKAFADEIYRHEGTIDKLMGDGLMALFGAPIAHEDDPARAVHAALGMQNALRRINVDLEERLGIALKVRIGLNSGLVVVGSIGSDLRMEYTALGDTVNVASRLQSVAEPGTIVASRSVLRADRALFDYRELGSIRVKNRVEPVEIFEAVAPRQIAGRVRGIAGLVAPMIGRAEELARLRGRGRRPGGKAARADRPGDRQCRHRQIAPHRGAKGLSRQPTGDRSSREDASGTVSPRTAFSCGLLRTIFDIAEDDPEEAVRAKIEETTRRLLPESSLNQVLPYVEHLFSLRIVRERWPHASGTSHRSNCNSKHFWPSATCWCRKAKGKPLVLIFEDIHWIDQLSLDLLTFILGAAEDAPLLIYCNSRPADGPGAPQVQRLGARTVCSEFHPDFAFPAVSRRQRRTRRPVVDHLRPPGKTQTAHPASARRAIRSIWKKSSGC